MPRENPKQVARQCLFRWASRRFGGQLVCSLKGQRVIAVQRCMQYRRGGERVGLALGPRTDERGQEELGPIRFRYNTLQSK